MGHRIPRWLYYALLGVFAAVFLYAGVRLGIELLGYAGDRAEYNQVAQYGPQGSGSIPKHTADPQGGDVPQGADTPQSRPQANPVDFDALRAINPDVVAWLVVDGTDVSYPVVLGGDNEYYLDHSFQNKRNGAGCPFLDYRCWANFSYANNTIYGHHMNDGSMFATLTRFKDEEFWNTHDTMTLYLPDGMHRLEIFAAYTCNDFLYNVPTFGTQEEHEAFLRQLMRRTRYRREGVTVTTDDIIVTLSTCTYEITDGRYVVHARFVD